MILQPYYYLLVMIFSILSCANINNLTNNSTRKSIVFIGNSLYDEGINFNTLKNDLNCQVELIWSGASTSSWHYATLCCVTLRAEKPDYVVIPLDQEWVMNPKDNITGLFWEKLEAYKKCFPTIIDSINQVLNESSYITNVWDFQSSYKHTFLPKIISIAKESGIQLVFTRMRFPYHTIDALGNYQYEMKYRQDLANYCEEQGVILLDYFNDPEIEFSDFGYGAHYNVNGRVKWTRQLTSDFEDIFNEKTPIHKIEQNEKFELLDSIQGNSKSDTLFTEQSYYFNVNGNTKLKWSYLVAGDPRGEVYLGESSIIEIKLEPISQLTSSLVIFASDGLRKINRSYIFVTDFNVNFPPKITPSQEYLTYVKKPTLIRAQVSDDNKPGGKLKYDWKLVRGKGSIVNQDDSTILFIPNEANLDVIYLTVSDGQYSRSENIRIIVNQTNQFKIISPNANSSYYPGDTIQVLWKAIDIDDCVVSLSVDGGLTFIETGLKTVTRRDTSWGDYKYVLPLDLPSTHNAIVKLRTYNYEVTTYSPEFRILQK